MKILASTLYIFLFIHSYSSLARVACTDIKNDLLALEYKLQNSCMKVGSDGLCCPPCIGAECNQSKNRNLNCMTKKDLEAEYNKKMAELIIQEGILSLSLGIESNHNALSDLSEKHIKDAQKYMDNMEESLDKADLLYLALYNNKDKDGQTAKTKDDESTIFAEYHHYPNKDNIEAYVEDKCALAQFSSMKFCSKFKELKQKNPNNFEAALETLKGFLKADTIMSNDDGVRKEKYKNYQVQLKIKQDTKVMTPGKFKESGPYKSLANLNKKLQAYKGSSKSKQNAEDILKMANKIKKITVGYKLEDTTDTAGADVSMDNTPTTNFFRENFSLPLKQLDLPSLIMDGDYKDHFKNSYERVSIDLKKHEQALLVGPANSGECKGKNINCFKQKCKNSRPSSIGICGDYYRYTKHEKVKEKLSTAYSCITNKGSTPDKKRECLQEVNENSTTSIAKLREELKNLERSRQIQDGHEVFAKLNLKKAMGIHALKSNYCTDHIQKTISISGVDKTDCGRDPNLSKGYEAYQLGVKSQEITIALNNQILNQDLAKLGWDGEDSKNLQKEFRERCKTDREEVGSLCQYYEDEEAWAQAVREDREARKNAIKIVPIKEKEPSYFKDATKTFATSFLNNSAPLIQSFFALQAQEYQTVNQISAIQNYDMAYMNSYNNFVNLSNSENGTYFSNFGSQNNGTSYSSLSSFQNKSTPYRDPNNPFQLSLNYKAPVLESSFYK